MSSTETYRRADVNMDHEFEHMRKDIELALDQVLAPARKKSMVKQIVTSSMKQVVEIPLKESGLEYIAKYNSKSKELYLMIGNNIGLPVM